MTELMVEVLQGEIIIRPMRKNTWRYILRLLDIGSVNQRSLKMLEPFRPGLTTSMVGFRKGTRQDWRETGL